MRSSLALPAGLPQSLYAACHVRPAHLLPTQDPPGHATMLASPAAAQRLTCEVVEGYACFDQLRERPLRQLARQLVGEHIEELQVWHVGCQRGRDGARQLVHGNG